jgi:hypothetical protein
MRIRLKDLQVFVECPAKDYFNQTALQVPQNRELEIVCQVIEKAYLSITETGFRSEWRRIIAWVDALSFKDINILDDNSFKVGKTTSEHCLNFLHTWYHTMYLKEDITAYIGLELEAQVGSHVLWEKAPIARLGPSGASILVITNSLKKDRELNRDIYARGLAFLLGQATLEDRIEVVFLTMGKEGGFTISDIKTNINSHARIKEKLINMVEAYGKRYTYPNPGDHCQSCIYHWRCII